MTTPRNHALEIAKKNELYSLIKFVGDYYGEPLESLRDYAKEIVQAYINKLDIALDCFKDLKSQCHVEIKPRVLPEIKPFRKLVNLEIASESITYERNIK